MQAGASALSVLTDEEFFGGSNDDVLTVARKFNYCPILRKDFMIDEYQITEAKSIGADAILLIAAMPYPQEIKRLSEFAHTFGLEVLVEVHSAEELHPHLFSVVDLIGVNNRDLKSFEVSIEVSKKLAGMIHSRDDKNIGEWNLSTPDTIHTLRGIRI